MQVTETKLKGVLIIDARVFKDSRGFFMESWHSARYRDSGLPKEFVQDNVSYSSRGVLRGLHFQNPEPQGKLVTVLQGEIFDVAVDIRMGSPTFGQSVGVTLSSDNNKQLWVPEGFAHGFCVMSETAMVTYKCTRLYAPQNESSLLWNDPDLGIAWPKLEYSLSEKDKKGTRLKDFSNDRLFNLLP